MSYYDDYVADGLCCESCGGFMGDASGYARFCDGCKPKPAKQSKSKSKRGAA